MKWPWVLVELEPEYIPVTGSGKPIEKQMQDRSFLEQVKNFGNNVVFIDIVKSTLDECRNIADEATTPEELKGCNKAIARIKYLLTLPNRAEKYLEAMKIQNGYTENLYGVDNG